MFEPGKVLLLVEEVGEILAEGRDFSLCGRLGGGVDYVTKDTLGPSAELEDCRDSVLDRDIRLWESIYVGS